jgi:hypothetical protein
MEETKAKTGEAFLITAQFKRHVYGTSFCSIIGYYRDLDSRALYHFNIVLTCIYEL